VRGLAAEGGAEMSLLTTTGRGSPGFASPEHGFVEKKVPGSVIKVSSGFL